MVFFRVVVIVFLSFVLVIVVCGLFATLVLLLLREMMWLLCLAIFEPDTAFAYDFLNAVGSLIGCSVSSLAVSGL